MADEREQSERSEEPTQKRLDEAIQRGGLMRVVEWRGGEIIAAAAIPFLVLMAAALLGNMIQHRLLWSTEPLRPTLAKISPAAGLKRLFSRQALVNFVKGLAKLALIGGIMAALLWPERSRLDGLVDTDPAGLLDLTRSLSLNMLGVVVAVLAVIAALD